MILEDCLVDNVSVLFQSIDYRLSVHSRLDGENSTSTVWRVREDFSFRFIIAIGSGLRVVAQSVFEWIRTSHSLSILFGSVSIYQHKKKGTNFWSLPSLSMMKKDLWKYLLHLEWKYSSSQWEPSKPHLDHTWQLFSMIQLNSFCSHTHLGTNFCRMDLSVCSTVAKTILSHIAIDLIWPVSPDNAELIVAKKLFHPTI